MTNAHNAIVNQLPSSALALHNSTELRSQFTHTAAKLAARSISRKFRSWGGRAKTANAV